MSAHVYVEGLPTSITEEDLTTLFYCVEAGS